MSLSEKNGKSEVGTGSILQPLKARMKMRESDAAFFNANGANKISSVEDFDSDLAGETREKHCCAPN